MKFFKLSFLLLILLYSVTSFGQWTKIESGTNKDLFSVHFPSANTGYIVGRSAAVLKSTDGGNTWNPMNTGLTWEILEAVYFINDNIGFMTGVTNGKVLKTVNGGNTWTVKTLPTTNDLNDIKFINDTVGFIVGYREIWKTTDQGTTWISQMANQSLSFPVFYSIEFLNKDTVFIAGVDGSTGRILKTTNGGNNWASQSFGNYMRLDVKFVNDTLGYTVGSNPDIYKTINGGVSWSIVGSSSFQLNRKLFFVNDTIGYTVGYPHHILSTKDGGITWSQDITNDTMDLQWVDFIDKNTGFVVGEGGRILKFSNNIPTSINKMTGKDETLEVFPNPAFNIVNIKLSNAEQQNIQISIVNEWGKTVYSEQILNVHKHLNKAISISDFNCGVYFLSVQTSSKKITKKIIANE